MQQTSRRVNALEQLVAPHLAAEARRVALALDERAREEAVRLKRFKGPQVECARRP
jgi:V/A-type H+-transporting ATPase subunit D